MYCRKALSERDLLARSAERLGTEFSARKKRNIFQGEYLKRSFSIKYDVDCKTRFNAEIFFTGKAPVGESEGAY